MADAARAALVRDDQAFADESAALAANQGLYNGFLVAGLVWGLLAADPVGFQVKVFFLGCVIVAGVYGAATVSRRILVVQAVPAALALAAVLIAGERLTGSRPVRLRPVSGALRDRGDDRLHPDPKEPPDDTRSRHRPGPPPHLPTSTPMTTTG